MWDFSLWWAGSSLKHSPSACGNQAFFGLCRHPRSFQPCLSTSQPLTPALAPVGPSQEVPSPGRWWVLTAPPQLTSSSSG